MSRPILICSRDTVFARMLELELASGGCSVQVGEYRREYGYFDVILLDLDTALPPPVETYHRMIGFTRGSAMVEESIRRRCSLILHRPFQMQLLRREILGEGDATPARTAGESPKLVRAANGALLLNGKTLTLTATERRLLECLLEARPNPVSREMLAGVIGESTANKTDVYVCLLRRKLAALTPARMIVTVRNKGYALK